MPSSVDLFYVRCGIKEDLYVVQVLALSRRGLQARGNGEESFLAPLEAIANSGITAGDALRRRFHEEWGGNVDHLFTEEFTY